MAVFFLNIELQQFDVWEPRFPLQTLPFIGIYTFKPLKYADFPIWM